MNLAKQIGEAIVGVLRKAGIVKGRAIKEVASWDGSAANYASTEQYCNACLINVNSAAGKTETADWTQDLCLLPIREPGDASDVYVKQAVYAAAGGHGITQVVKPESVEQAAWDAAVVSAANALIGAYEEMDEQAPESVYAAAGKEAPEEPEEEMAESAPETPKTDAIAGMMLGDTVWEMIYDAGGWFLDTYHTATENYAVAAKEGALYKVPIVIGEGDTVTLGEWQRVVTEHVPAAGATQTETPATETPAEERFFRVRRQSDGRYRWVAVSCTAVLNRVGEIDSTKLFDSFVERINDGEPMPQLDFFHVDGTDMGEADFVARDGFTLVASGLFEDSAIGRAAAEGLTKDPGYWGTSILYAPTSEPQLVDFSGITIPVYEQGILRKITILPEARAAALFTNITKRSKDTMKKEVSDALKKLLGDDALVAEMAGRVDGVNRMADTGAVVARDTATVKPLLEQQSSAAETEAIKRHQDHVTALTDEVNAQATVIAKLLERADTAEARLKRLEATDSERHAAWLSDLPEVRQIQALYRPRQTAEEPEGKSEPTTGERVDEVLKKKGLQ